MMRCLRSSITYNSRSLLSANLLGPQCHGVSTARHSPSPQFDRLPATMCLPWDCFVVSQEGKDAPIGLYSQVTVFISFWCKRSSNGVTSLVLCVVFFSTWKLITKTVSEGSYGPAWKENRPPAICNLREAVPSPIFLLHCQAPRTLLLQQLARSSESEKPFLWQKKSLSAVIPSPR